MKNIPLSLKLYLFTFTYCGLKCGMLKCCINISNNTISVNESPRKEMDPYGEREKISVLVGIRTHDLSV